jgi:Flp pilus assembly protein TadG
LGPQESISRRRNRRDEKGAEVVEFAIIVVLLVGILYGILSMGIIMAVKVSVTQAAADGARAAIVQTGSSQQYLTAYTQASNDLSWLGQGACTPSTTIITCQPTEAPCAANTSQTCITVKVTYNYAKHPIFPTFPGLNFIEPQVISSTTVLQTSTPSS